MSLDHNAILKAYPNAVVVDDGVGVLDSSGNSISIAVSYTHLTLPTKA